MTMISALLTLVTTTFAPAEQIVSFQVDGVERKAIVVAPKKRSARPPLILVFHGHGASGRIALRQFPIAEHWPEAVVIYPNGLPTPGGIVDLEGKKPGWQLAPGTQGNRDVNFTDAMLKWAKAKYSTDLRRTFVCGHSNGSRFTWVLHATRPDAFAAFAGMCAGGGMLLRNTPDRPVFIVAGTDDPLIPIGNMRRFADDMVKKNGCKTPSVEVAPGVQAFDGPNPVWVYIYEGRHLPPANMTSLLVRFFRTVTGA
jgi:polyhydroxybutyrate depolymerase